MNPDRDARGEWIGGTTSRRRSPEGENQLGGHILHTKFRRVDEFPKELTWDVREQEVSPRNFRLSGNTLMYDSVGSCQDIFREGSPVEAGAVSRAPLFGVHLDP